jgi:hypothetical protein
MSHGEESKSTGMSSQAQREAAQVLNMEVQLTSQEQLRGWAIRRYEHVGRVVLWSVYGSKDSPQVAYHCDLPTDRAQMGDLAVTIDEYLT